MSGICPLFTSPTSRVWLHTRLHRLKSVLHYALGSRFGKENVRKTREKRNWLAFLPYVYCNIEPISCVFLAFFFFSCVLLAFFLRSSCVFTHVLDTNMLIYKMQAKCENNARKIKNASETTHTVIRPLVRS